MKKLLLLAVLVSGSMSSFASETYDRCDAISQKLAGRYSVSLLKLDGTKLKAGKVKLTRTNNSKIFKASNLEVIGDILLPGAPKKVILKSMGEECLFVGVGKIESNTLGSIIEGEDMKVFSVQVDDEIFESVSFSKF